MEFVYKYVSFKPKHSKTLENVIQNRIYFSKTTDRKYRDDCVVLTELEINSYGIFSTSDSFKHLSLWSDFGGENSGICVEYDLNKILATSNHIIHKQVDYTIENSQMSTDLFNLPKKFKEENEIRFVLSNISSEEDRIVTLLENTITRIFLSIDFFDTYSRNLERLHFFNKINSNIPIIHLTKYSCFNSYTTITKEEVIAKLNAVLGNKTEDITIPN
jgi:hypothetical protein